MLTQLDIYHDLGVSVTPIEQQKQGEGDVLGLWALKRCGWIERLGVGREV